MTDAPERIWADPPQIFDDMDCWHSTPHERRTEYIRADKVAALVEAAQEIVDGHDEGVGFTFWIEKARAALAAFKVVELLGGDVLPERK